MLKELPPRCANWQVLSTFIEMQTVLFGGCPCLVGVLQMLLLLPQVIWLW